MRVFWAGSHVIARLFELPLYVAAGMEIIPSEVVPGIHTFGEGPLYDDPGLAINRLWRGSVSLPESVLTTLRRSRLWERDGQISPDEVDLFNRHIDVICVPTRLKLALAVGRWFKGVILYRYYGDFRGFGPSDTDDVGEIDSELRRRMVFVPVFGSLLDTPVASLFEHVRLLRAYFDETMVPRRWAGFDPGAPAIVVLGSVHQFPHFQELLRALFPLAAQIPIRLAGKNVASRVPIDIARHFELRTDLPRDEFFDVFMTSQFLIYPHAMPGHSHSVPFEASYAGMPIMLRTRTPLFAETRHPVDVWEDPARIGAAATNTGLIRNALRLYGNQAEARQLVERQRQLFGPFRREAVDSQFTALKSLIEELRPHNPPPSSPRAPTGAPLVSFPTADYFRVRNSITEHGFRAPLAKFFADEQLSRVEFRQQRLFLRITPENGQLAVVLGGRGADEAVLFGTATGHQFAVDVLAKGRGRVDAVLELWAGERVHERKTALSIVDSSSWIPCGQVFTVASAVPFVGVLFLSARGEIEILAGEVAHDEVKGCSSCMSPERSTTHPRGVIDLILGDEAGAGPEHPIVPGVKVQLVSSATFDPRKTIAIAFDFDFDSSRAEVVADIEYWVDDAIALRTTRTLAPSTGRLQIVDRLAGIDAPSAKAVVYILGVSGEARLLSLMLWEA